MNDREAMVAHWDRLWRVAQALLAVVGAFLVASAITAPLTDVLVSADLVADGGTGWQITRTVIQFLGFLVAVAGFLYVTDEWDLIGVDRLGTSGAALVVGGTVALLVVQFALVWLFGLVGVDPGQNRAMLPGQENPQYFLYMIVVSIVVVGPVEEILFRGVVQGLLRRAFAAWPAILIASAVFGLVHLFAVDGTTGQALLYASVAALLGCLLGFLYEYTGNIVVPSLAHGLYNGTLFAIQFVYYTVYA